MVDDSVLQRGPMSGSTVGLPSSSTPVANHESLYARTTAERRANRRATSIGYYDLDKSIGEGNFAKVKLATHTLTGERVRGRLPPRSNCGAGGREDHREGET